MKLHYSGLSFSLTPFQQLISIIQSHVSVEFNQFLRTYISTGHITIVTAPEPVRV